MPVSLGARLTAATYLGNSADGAFGVGKVTVVEVNAFSGEEAEFLRQGGPRAAAFEAADGQIGRDDAVAGDLGGEGIGAEGLADGSWRAAADDSPESGVGDDAARRDFAQRGVNLGCEG